MKAVPTYCSHGLGADAHRKIGSLLNGLKLGPPVKVSSLEELPREAKTVLFFNGNKEFPYEKTSPSRTFLVAVTDKARGAMDSIEKGSNYALTKSEIDADGLSKVCALAERHFSTSRKNRVWKNQLNLLLKHGHDALILQNEDNEILFASPPTREILKSRKEKLKGQVLLDFLLPADKEIFKTDLKKLAGGKTDSVVSRLRVVEATGKAEKWIEFKTSDYSQNENIGGYVTIIRDVDEEHRAKMKQALAELKFRTLVETTSDGVWHHDLVNDEVEWSDSLYQILGYDVHSDFEGANIIDLAHPDDRAKVEREISEKVNIGHPYSIEFRIKNREDKYIWIKAEGSGIRRGSSKTEILLGSVKNIHKQKRVELELEESRNSLENIANGITGVLSRHRTYPDGTSENLYLSSGVKEIWGLKREDLLANPELLAKRLSEEEALKLQKAFRDSMSNLTKVDHLIATTDDDGNARWLQTVAVPTEREDGSIEYDSLTTDVTKLKQTEEKAKDQQELLNNIINNLNGVVQRYMVRPDGKAEIVFLSEGFRKITGKSVSQAFKNPKVIWDGIVEEDRNRIKRTTLSAIKNLTAWEQTWRVYDDNGNVKWLQGSGTPVKRSDGGVILDTVTTDITKLKSISSALAAAKQEFQLATKAAQLGLWKYNPVNNNLWWDDQMFKIYGLDTTKFTGKSDVWENALHPDDKKLALESLADSVGSGSDLDFQFRILKSDTGETRHIRASAYTMLNSKDEAILMVGLNWDVTHLVRAQEKIAVSNNRYALAAKAVQNAIWDLDLKTESLKWSPAFSQLFGHEVDQENDRLEDWEKLVHPDDHDRVAQGLREFIETDQHKWEEEYRFRKGNGDYAYVVDRGFIVRDHSGKAVRMVGSVQDITANTEYLNAIKAQNEQLKKIAWIQSHELRGPLTRIMGLVQLVEEDGLKDLSLTDFLKHLNSASQELDEVIKGIVDASKEVGVAKSTTGSIPAR